MVFDVVWTLGLAVVIVVLWRIKWVLTVTVDNQVEQTSNILLEVERIRVQMFMLSKDKPEIEQGWEDFDEGIRRVAADYLFSKRFTLTRL